MSELADDIRRSESVMAEAGRACGGDFAAMCGWLAARVAYLERERERWDIHLGTEAKKHIDNLTRTQCNSTT